MVYRLLYSFNGLFYQVVRITNYIFFQAVGIVNKWFCLRAKKTAVFCFKNNSTGPCKIKTLFRNPLSNHVIDLKSFSTYDVLLRILYLYLLGYHGFHKSHSLLYDRDHNNYQSLLHYTYKFGPNNLLHTMPAIKAKL